MQSFVLLLAVFGLTSALPKPQLIDTDGVEAAPAPVFITPAYDVLEQDGATNKPAIAPRGRLYRRDGTCATQPPGSGPVSSPDTPDAFLSNPDFAALANNATTPDGYSMVMQNNGGSLSALNYMGLKTLKSYDTLGCASLCDQASGCQAFNMYIERDPSLDPNADSCPNPPSITNYKCTLWGAAVSAAEATNKGQWRDSFQVVIAGSNAYNKASPPPAIACYTGPVELGGAINAPYNAQGQNTYMGYKYHPFSQSQGYDPSTCAADCNAQTAYNKRHPAADGSYQTCSFFNAYVLSVNGVPQGLYCSMYTQVWAASYATNYGQYRGTDRYSVSRSYSYSLNLANDGSASCASSTASYSSISQFSTSTSSTSQFTTSQSTTASLTTAQTSNSTTTAAETSSASVESSTTTSPATSPQSTAPLITDSQTAISQSTTPTSATSESAKLSESTASQPSAAQSTLSQVSISQSTTSQSSTTLAVPTTSISSSSASDTVTSAIVSTSTTMSTLTSNGLSDMTTSISSTLSTTATSDLRTLDTMATPSSSPSSTITMSTPSSPVPETMTSSSTASTSTFSASTTPTTTTTSSPTTTNIVIAPTSSTFSTTATPSPSTASAVTTLTSTRSSTMTTSISSTSIGTTSSSSTTSAAATPLASFCLQNPSTGQFASLSKGGNGLAFSPITSKNLASLFTLDSASRLTSTVSGLFAVLDLRTFGTDGSTEGHISGTTLDQVAINQNLKPMVCDVASRILTCRSAANYIDPKKSPASRSQVDTTTKGNDGVDQFVFAPTSVVGAVPVKVLPASACGPNYS